MPLAHPLEWPPLNKARSTVGICDRELAGLRNVHGEAMLIIGEKLDFAGYALR